MSNINSETSFLYQLFKENSNFIGKKVIQGYLSAFYDVFVLYLFIHFKAFPVSTINSKTSFVYQLFKENSNFIVFTTCKVIYLSIFFIIIFIIINMYSYFYLCIYTPSYQHFKAFPVPNINFETSFVY